MGFGFFKDCRVYMEFGDFQCYNRNHLFRGIGARKTEVPLLSLADL